MRSTPSPLITVAMPVFNAGPHLRAAVQSITQQTLTDWELLLLDDGSTDGAIEALDCLADPRIQVIRDGRNTGIAVRLNQAIDLARGTYLARMDADDIAHPERLARQLAALQADTRLDLVATRAITIDAGHQIGGGFPYALAHEDICARPWLGFHFPHPTWMGKTQWFRAHRYAEPAPFRCEDQELLLRSHGSSRFATIDDVLLAYRVRPTTDWRQLARVRRATRQYQVRFFMQRGQPQVAALSVLAWLSRTGRDHIRRWTQSAQRVSTVALPAATQAQWRQLLDALARRSTT